MGDPRFAKRRRPKVEKDPLQLMREKEREGTISAGIKGYLELRKDIFFWRNNTGAYKKGEHYIEYGLPGSSDYLGVQMPSGRFVAIEVKKVGQTLKPNQEEFKANVEACGGLFVEADTIQDVINALGPIKGKFLKVGGKASKRLYPTE